MKKKLGFVVFFSLSEARLFFFRRCMLANRSLEYSY